MMTPAEANQPVAIFDSGVGGLSVLRVLRNQLPGEQFLYLADQAHVPYGARPAAEIQRLSEAITHFLLAREAKLVVVACNTASAASLTHLRATFPDIPFVGMEPAVKPAAVRTRSGKVGVMATAGTFESQRYEQLMARFARDVVVYEDSCPGLVEQIEGGVLDGPEAEQRLHRCLAPMLAAGVDVVVLGCTHYPFVAPLLQRIAGDEVVVIDPAPAVARQTGRVLADRGWLGPDAGEGSVSAFTTGDAAQFGRLAQQLLGYPVPVSEINWRDGRLVSA
ncbi:MAG: glutamate racemase [Anaerolineae bacterium]